MQHHSLESPDDWPGNLAGSSSGAVSAAVPGGVDADVKFYGVTDASRMLTTLLGSLTFREGGKGNATSGPVAFCEVHDHGFLFTVNGTRMATIPWIAAPRSQMPASPSMPSARPADAWAAVVPRFMRAM